MHVNDTPYHYTAAQTLGRKGCTSLPAITLHDCNELGSPVMEVKASSHHPN